MKKTSFNQYAYNGHSGFFNIYQGKNGCIYIQMGSAFTALNLQQINALCIDLYSLPEFDIDNYKLWYKI